MYLLAQDSEGIYAVKPKREIFISPFEFPTFFEGREIRKRVIKSDFFELQPFDHNGEEAYYWYISANKYWQALFGSQKYILPMLFKSATLTIFVYAKGKKLFNSPRYKLFSFQNKSVIDKAVLFNELENFYFSKISSSAQSLFDVFLQTNEHMKIKTQLTIYLLEPKEASFKEIASVYKRSLPQIKTKNIKDHSKLFLKVQQLDHKNASRLRKQLYVDEKSQLFEKHSVICISGSYTISTLF